MELGKNEQKIIEFLVDKGAIKIPVAFKQKEISKYLEIDNGNFCKAIKSLVQKGYLIKTYNEYQLTDEFADEYFDEYSDLEEEE